MRARAHVAAVIFAGVGVVAAAGEGAALASSGAPASAYAGVNAQARTADTPKHVVLNCSLKPVVEPSTFTIACADGGIGVKQLHWTSWTPKLASGYGTFWENDCKPDCAHGQIHYYQSREVLWGSATVAGHPAERRYTKLTVIFTGKNRPPVYVLKHGKLVAAYPLTQTFPAI